MLPIAFAGSSHSKYRTYLLEIICSLELESTPALRDAILTSAVINLTGRQPKSSKAPIQSEFF